jgi:hypothetical protein
MVSVELRNESVAAGYLRKPGGAGKIAGSILESASGCLRGH